jgi:hypothetical protein
MWDDDGRPLWDNDNSQKWDDKRSKCGRREMTRGSGVVTSATSGMTNGELRGIEVVCLLCFRLI